MAMIMSLNESLVQAAPGVGILLGGAIAALAGPRVALAVAAPARVAGRGDARPVAEPRALPWPAAGRRDGARGARRQPPGCWPPGA